MGNPCSACTVEQESGEEPTPPLKDQKLTGSLTTGVTGSEGKDPHRITTKEEKDRKPECSDENSQEPRKTRVRDPKHVFDITFTKSPLGVKFTSSRSGKCVYVTETDGKVNQAVNDSKLPKDSKLLKINNIDVESQAINDTVILIRKEIQNLPMTMTFCHPDGLEEHERQDPHPKLLL